MASNVEDNLGGKILLTITNHEFVPARISAVEGYTRMDWTHELIDHLREFDQMELLQVSIHLMKALCMISNGFDEVLNILTYNEIKLEQKSDLVDVTEDIESMCAVIKDDVDTINAMYQNKIAQFDSVEKVLLIYIDDNLDRDHILRNNLWAMYNSDDKLCQDDVEYQRSMKLEQISIDEPVKKCYFVNQECAAQLLMKRIEIILGKYHRKKLSDFNDFDFMIYTARSNMLEKQTINRLCVETAECFHQDDYSDLEKLEEMARKRVRKYVITKTTKPELEEMKADAVRNPNKLILIVADEAHWGISGQTNLGVSANNALVNAWDDQYPNVIVLLVTATPWNLLTQNSRIPWVTIAEKRETGEFVEVERMRNQLIDPSTRSNVTNKVGPEKELHILRWTESCEDSFKRGLVIVLRVPQKENDPEMWLTAVERNKIFVLTRTTNKREATPLLLRMKNNVVTVETMEKNGSITRILITTKKNNEFFVHFVPVDCLASKDCSTYKLLMEFGEDIIELQPCLPDNIQLMYDSEKDLVCTGRRPAENKIDNFLVYHSLTYSFIVDSKYGIDLTEPGEQYLSLNFYYNTMRNEDQQKRLIRNDKRFEAMAKKILESSDTIDDMLAAEYSYYIILVNIIRESFARPFNIHEFLDNPRTCWHKYILMKKEKLMNFEKELENCDLSGETFKPISHLVFNKVAKYLQEESWTELWRVGKDLSKIKKATEDEYAEFVECFVAYLMHAGKDFEIKMPEMKKLTLRHIPHLISQLSSSDEKEKTDSLTHGSETFRIVNDLINDRTIFDIKGRMKIIRVNDKAIGNRFYATLSLARKLGQDGGMYFFEIIRYFEKLKLYDKGNMNESCRRIWQELQRNMCESFTDEKTREKCQCESYVGGEKSIACMNCQHDHTNIEQFSDLNNLPCVVIVIEKARIGETFPASFNCMDLRLRNRVQNPKLTSLMQELGRLCRYQEKCDYSEMPYVLIGPAVEKKLREYLNKSAVFHSSYKNGNVDTYTSKSDPKYARDIMPSRQTKSRRQAAHQPNNKNYDNNNMEQHQNRLLLQAEPQIGKTGVFLKLISLLRLKIIGFNQKDNTEFEDDNDSESDQDVDNNEMLADKWKYPYWKDVEKNDSLKTVISNSKYSRLFGEYHYRIPPSYFNAGRKVKKGKRKINKSQNPCIDNGPFRALSHIEHNHCLECKSDAPVSQYLIKMNQLEHKIKILVPSLKRYEPMTHILTKKNLAIDDTIPTDSILKTWIFNPTYMRATDATINYFHAMASQETESQNQYIQILVVRPDDFNRYASLWQSTHAILQLPDCLPGCDVDVNSGGIGFARRFIQLFAEHLKLDLIFMLDDNIYSIFSADTNVNDDHKSEQASSSNSSPDMSIEKISFFDALQHLEKLFDCKSDPPNFVFEKYDLNDLDMDCQKNNDLHTFTGSKGSYGIVGMLRYRPGSLKVRKPFTKTHVHSLVLINIAALKDKSIAYKPWQVHEDLNINNECDEKSLTVCKFNRFLFSKKQLKSWMPSVYIWSENDRLESRKKRADASAKIILQWIRVNDPPDKLKIGCIEDNNLKAVSHTDVGAKLQLSSGIEQKERPNLQELFILLSGLMSVKAGKSHILALFNQNRSVSINNKLLELIHEYFRTTEGIGAFTTHIVIIETTVCFKLGLRTVGDFQKQLVDPVFEKNSKLQLLTSHNIADFDVPFVIVCIEGTIKNRIDEEANREIGTNKNDVPVQVTESCSGNNDKPVKGSRKRRQPTNSTSKQKVSKRARIHYTLAEMSAKLKLSTLNVHSSRPICPNTEKVSPLKNDVKNEEIPLFGISVDDLEIFDNNEQTSRPINKDTAIHLSKNEELKMKLRSGGSSLSSYLHDKITRQFNITYDQ